MKVLLGRADDVPAVNERKHSQWFVSLDVNTRYFNDLPGKNYLLGSHFFGGGGGVLFFFCLA